MLENKVGVAQKVNFFLCAAPRSGSTQLAAWLASHPDIGIAPIKEPNFFSQHEYPELYVRKMHLNDVDPESYVKRRSKKVMQFAIFRERSHYEYLYENLGQAWRLDASTTYLHAEGAAEAIYAYNPNARIVLLKRNPVDRALSHYRLAIRTGRTTRPLAKELSDELKGLTPLPGRFLLRQSLYEDAISSYKSIFPNEQVLELAFEDVIRNPDAALKQVSDFLGIDASGFDTSIKEQNAGDAPRFSTLNAWLMKSGAKSVLRNIIPRPIKRLVKPLYFSPKSNPNESADRALIEQHLQMIRDGNH